jgi:tetratricopeptide (TPR) repeat protein
MGFEYKKPLGPLGRIYHFYAELLGRRVFAWVMLVYAVIAFGSMLYFSVSHWLRKSSESLNARLTEVSRELETQRRIVASLASVSKNASIMKEIQFKEDWNEETKAKATRVLDYVNYAYSKSDFDYARRQLSEAPELQGSQTAGYWLARIDFAARDLDGAIAELNKVIAKDRENNYPILRFYAGVLSYELGRQEEMLAFLKAYMSSQNPKGP